MSAGPAMEMWSRQTGSGESDGKTYKVSFARAFTIVIGMSDRIEVAAQASGLPLIGDLYPGTLFVVCTRVSLERPSPIMAIATCEYSGEIGNDGGGNASSPIDNTPVIRWGCSVTDEAIDEDWNGKPIVTKNNEPIEGITERFVDDVLYVERNYLTINRYAVREYRKATNSDTFAGWPAGTARLMNDEADAVFINGSVAYWRVRATIQFREPYRTTAAKAWYHRVRHEGYYVRDTAGGDPHIAFDQVTKTPVTKPVLLKSNGTLETNSDNAHWLEFQTLGSLPFNALGLL